MDPVIAAVVSALSAGALAMTKGFATAAAKDAYGALKSFIVERVGAAQPEVEYVEKKPSQAAANLLADELAPLAGDSEAQQLATALMSIIEQNPKQPGVVAALDLMNSIMGDFTAKGSNLKGQLLHASNSSLGNLNLTNTTVDTSIVPVDPNTGPDQKKKV
jgi:hypothetical protein